MNDLARLFLLSLIAVGASSCATTPATVARIEFSDQHSCELDQEPLESLLEIALGGNGSAEAEHALAHFVERWKVERGDVSVGVVPDGDQSRRVRFVGESEALAYFDRISPAVDFKLGKLEHHRRDGIGATLAALRHNHHRESIEKYYPAEAITRPLTAVLRPDVKPGEVQVELLSPLHQRRVDAGGERKMLAADLSVPWAMLLSRSKALSKSGLGDLLRTNPKRTPQLYLMEPYDPQKEPLIMIHGLRSTPLSWAKVSNELWADKAIRERYQIWHFLYNTSAPALYSGRILRTQLRELRPMLDPTGRDPAMRSTTVIAHSMGGIVTRSLLVEPGDVFWDAAFTRPIGELQLTTSDRDSLMEAFKWKPEAHIKRVIFIAASLRGSDVADSWKARFARRIVKPPNQFAAFYERISTANPGAFKPAYAELAMGKLDSIHALSPTQPTLKILAALPDRYPVTNHSIIAVDGKYERLEDSHDGYVPYWSSHLPNAVSEKIVQSGHFAMNQPETLAEIKRILLEDK